MTRLWCLPLFLCFTLGCENEQPVLTGIPSKAILKANPTPDSKQGTEQSRTYKKSPVVWIDARHLGGKKFNKVRDLVGDQFGPLQSSRDLDPGKGRELSFERGIVRTTKGTIYMMRIPLPYPMRRSEALEKLGFPPYVGGYTGFHREYRLHNEWGFRRIRMKRENRHSERVTQVETWRWLPGERGPGR